MIAEHLEPKGLDPDTPPLADFYADAEVKADAKRGSARLLKALIGASPRPKRDYRARIEKRYGTWEDRQMALGQVGRLQRAVAAHYGISPDVMTDGRGLREFYAKRHIAIYLARTIIKASYPDLGKAFDKDHTTIINSCRVVEDDPDLLAEARAVRTSIGA